MSFPEESLTRDRFLGGRLRIRQPAGGYRAGIDPVLLAASVPARSGQSVLELGCGAGVASLCLAARVDGLSLAGVELQPDYAELARRNAEENGQSIEVHVADLRALPRAVKERAFDHVIANPPYFARARGTASDDAGRDVALAGETPLADWIDAAARRLAHKGFLSVIQDIRRLPELLDATRPRLGSIEALPISARNGRAPHLVLLRARKGGRAEFRLHFPLVMHEGERHERDADSYTARITEVLRHGAPLPFPGD